MIILLLVFVLLCFGLVVLFGAPYLPTLKPQVDEAFKLLNLKKGQTLLDLGSGDGALLIAASKRGIKSVGYELNPILFVISWLRLRKYRHLATVKFGNYWRRDWPEVDGIFVFLHTRFMQKLHTKVVIYAKQKPVKLVSFTFEIPQQKLTKSEGGLFLYNYGHKD